MPISSNNHRLTKELYKPPPKSLEQIQMEERLANGSELDSSAGGRGGSPGSTIKREKHLDHIPFKKTAVVGPIKEPGIKGYTNGAFINTADDVGMIKKTGASAGVGGAKGSAGAAAWWAKACCLCQGMFCSRFSVLAFLLGLLLGALITGLIVGLILGEQLAAAQAAALSTTPATQTGCLQSPCASAQANCSYTDNNTMINCVCQPSMGEPVSTAGINAGGYQCSFYNTTSSTAAPATAT